MSDVKGVSASSSFDLHDVTASSTPSGPDASTFTIINLPTAVQIVNGVVTPNLQVLLFDTLSSIDASIPNKDQNKAVKRIVHDAFDRCYMAILRETYPDCNFANGPGHAIQPMADKYAAITGTALKS